MRGRYITITAVLVAVLTTSAGYAQHLVPAGNNTSISFSDKGQVSGLVVNGKTINAEATKGFYTLPAVGKGKPDFFKGTFTPNSQGGTLTLTSGKNLKLKAKVSTGKGFIRIDGYIEKTEKKDQAVWLCFELPSISKSWKTEDSMGNSYATTDQKAKKDIIQRYGVNGNNIYPMIAGSAQEAALGLAIAPDSPAIFLTDADEDKLGIRLALGMSSATKNFPNRAPFKIEIYGIQPEWGFRGLLETYYNNYPEYYETTPRKIKLFNNTHDWLTAGKIDDDKKRKAILVDPNKKEHTYYFKTSCRIKELKGAIKVSKKIEDMNKLINGHTYFHIQCDKDTKPDAPEAVLARQRMINSMNHNPDGTTPVVLKENEIDVPHNGDPDLFADLGKPTQGEWYMKWCKKWYDSGRFAVMHWDRFGGWGNGLNYRKDHFAYVDYALTFDTEGRVCIANKFTYWKLMKRLRQWGMKNNQFCQEVAGLKQYSTEKQFSQPAGLIKDGRFFTGAVVDAGWHEGSFKPISLGGMDSERVFVGRKSYRISTGNIVAHKEEPTLERVKRALAQTSFYGFSCPVQTQYYFPEGHPGYHKEYSYYHKPEHKALWGNYLPALEQIRIAGWEPVTLATGNFKGEPDFGIERYGESGRDSIYLTVWGPEPPKAASITVDYKAMGFKTLPNISELVADTKVQVSDKDGEAVLTFVMEKNMTRILKLSK